MTKRAARGAVAALLSVPASGALLLATAPAALAASGISSPAADTVYTTGTSTTVVADLDPCASTTKLRVDNPQNDNYWETTSSRPSACDSPFNKPTTPRRVSLKPTWTAAMPNGRFTITLSGGATATRYFYTSLAPSTPSGLTAQGTGATRIDLSWTYDGTEPDLTGFVVSDDKGNSYPVNDPKARSLTVTYDNPTPGTYDYSFTVKALRKNGTGDGTVAGSDSLSASAQLVTPQPPPSPTPAPTETGSPGGGSGGGTGGSTPPSGAPGSGGSTGGSKGAGGSSGSSGKPNLSIPTLSPVVQARRDYALSFNSFSPSLGIPKLPPLPATSFAGNDGTYQPTLPYGAQGSAEDEPVDVLADPLAAVKRLDSAGLAKSLAFALILLGAAAHLRLFVHGHRGD